MANTEITEENTSKVKTCKNIDECNEPRYVRNYSIIWLDGDVICSKCGEYIRPYDAG